MGKMSTLWYFALIRIEMESLLKFWVVVRLAAVTDVEPDVDVGVPIIEAMFDWDDDDTSVVILAASFWLVPFAMGVSNLYHFSIGWLFSIELTGMFI